MVVVRGKFYNIGEGYFDEVPRARGVDVVRRVQSPMPEPGARCAPFSTLVLDLQRTDDELLAGFDKDTRYEVRRAAKEGLRHATFGSDRAALAEFVTLYDEFAAAKGLAPAPRVVLEAYADAGVLELTAAVSAEAGPLVWHAYYRASRRVRLLHSASLFRQSGAAGQRALIGRANRWLHFVDMTFFRGQGFLKYDFGGFDPDNEDEEIRRVNAFKQGFGGEVVREHVCERGVTLRGRAVVALTPHLPAIARVRREVQERLRSWRGRA